MTRRPRVLMIGRHFWPHGSIDSSGILMQIARALHRRGAHVEVLSAKYGASWAETIQVREIPVHRVASVPRSDWGMGRYTRTLAAWLQQHAESFDVLLVDSVREEAMVAVDIARTLGVKTILRFRGFGAFSDASWWESSRLARRCAAMARGANAVIANSSDSERALVIQGIDPERIERIPHGIAVMQGRSLAHRLETRRALAAANGDLFAEADAPVLLCTARMVRNQGIDLLVQAAPTLIARYPNLRIWFIGDGPYREAIYQKLRGDGVRASIAMPGSFADPEDLFAAADLYLQTDEDGLEYFMGMAAAWELPIVAVDSPTIRSFIDAGPARHRMSMNQGMSDDPGRGTSFDQRSSDWIQWCDSASPKGVRIGVSRTLDDLHAARQRASLLRRGLIRQRPLSSTADAYMELIGRLTQHMPPQARNHETEIVS